ncbi:PREDICTED: uncharacterized protein LOC108358205 [Rhagoletis zephyria]|uniref:uncharacterized protein LOC108358205 n=1 Tax=Rhagoletis zephyria TaxID=28612 RepID=UPI0008112B91|nr:PREDICTED: uncharacterized protein LOC108358205 [Rhagoletis zephyria]
MSDDGNDRFEDAATPVHVARLALKPPPFWKPNPRLWFAQVEAQFVRAGISTDETKYYTVVAEIDSAVLAHASDIITSPPASGKYELLKERLITEFGESKEKRLKRLFEGCRLGDKKATTLLREMKDLADQHIDKEVLKSLWLQRLPTNIQQILATFDGSIEELALKADTIMEISATNVDVNVVKVPDDGMQAAISDLTNRLDRLTRNNQRNFVRSDRSYTNNVSHSQRPVSSRQGASTPKQDTLCWYHRTFGDSATRCRSPCTYRQQRAEN